MTAVLEVKGLQKHFPVKSAKRRGHGAGVIRAVDDVSFKIEEGRTLALVGESGCGKTTTAKMILRLQKPTAGEVLLDGRDIHQLEGADLKWYRLNVQAVFQDPWGSLSPRRRVSDIVAEPLIVNQVASRKEARSRVIELLEQVGMRASHANLFPHEFSGGQRQRIALAMALITKPRVVILDEPVSALDVSVQAQVLNLLRRIQREQGTTFLLIAHDLSTVRYVAHEVAVMYMGEVVEKGLVEDVYENPGHPYTRALFESTLPDHPDQLRTVPIRGEMPNPMNPPGGCRFRTRCPLVMPICQTVPPAFELESGHLARCHLLSPEPVVAHGGGA